MLFADPSFIAFEVINSGGVVISEHRYAAAVTQSLPLLASWLGLPLSAVLGLYSVGFYLLYVGVAWVVGSCWKQYGLATLLGCYFTLIVSDGYFWPNNEVHQGVAWAVLFLGRYFYLLAPRRPPRWSDHALLIGTVVLATNAHLLVAAPLFFLWTYFHLDRLASGLATDWKRLAAYTLLIVAGIGLRYYLSHDSWYDGYKLRGVQSLSPETVWDSLRSGQARTAWKLLWRDYLTLPILLLVGLVAAWRTRRWWSALLVLPAVVVYVVLVCVTYPAGFGRALLYYYESEWAGLGVIVATPLVVHLRGISRRHWVGFAVAGLLFVPRLGAIWDSHRYFADRRENLEATVVFLRARDGTKFATRNEALLGTYFGIYWGLPNELTLAAALKNPAAPQVALYVAGGPPLVEDDPAVYHSNFRRQPVRSLHPDYFRPDTTSTYRLLSPQEEEEWAAILHRLPR
jgi:hypothetical protein